MMKRFGVVVGVVWMSLAAAAQDRREWIPINTQAKEGAPIVASVLYSNTAGTKLQLEVSGVWLETVEYQGRSFTKIIFPQTLLGGEGFKEGEEWFQFPRETEYPPLPSERFRTALFTGVYKPVFPASRAILKPPYPTSGAEISRLGIDPAGARPGIPRLRGFLAVRADQKLDGIRIEQTNTNEPRRLQLNTPLLPAGYEGSDQIAPDNYGYIPLPFIDEEFYQTQKEPYQGVEPLFTEVSRVGAFATVQLQIPLMTLLPGNLVEIPSIVTIDIIQSLLEYDIPCPLAWDNWIFTFPFINGEALRDALAAKGIKIESSRYAHYLILTPESYRSTLSDFISWKRSKGLNVDVVTVGSGADLPNDRSTIDAYIEAKFKEFYCWGLYVLIIGDRDVIQSGRTTRIDASPDASDADSDHVYEVLGTDRFPSIYVGRLSCNSVSELQNQLDKILSYEKDPVGGTWPRKAALCANSENDDGSRGVSTSHPSKYAAAVNDVAGWGSYTDAPSFQVYHAGAKTTPTPRAVNADVISAINEGVGQVLYRGHGNGTSWVGGWDGSSTDGNSFDSTNEVPSLANKAFPIVYSIACQNNRILNSDSVGEVWMSQANSGAVAYWGASVNSYTTENHKRALGVFRAIYESGFTRLGPALGEAESISYGYTGGGSSWDNNTFCYLLLGDPELTIRRRTVFSKELLHVNLQSILQNTVFQLNDAQGVAVPGALVNVVLNDGSSVNGFTNVRGELTLNGIEAKSIARYQIHAEQFPYLEGGAGAEATPTPTETRIVVNTPTPTPTRIVTVTPTPTKPIAGGFDGCVQASDRFTSYFPSGVVNLGGVEFLQAYFPDGLPVPLSVQDCSGDGLMDIVVPWSGDTASLKAAIVLSPNLCGERGPQMVEVTLSHGFSCKLYGYDRFGSLIAMITADPGNHTQTLQLANPGGIRRILIEGAEICIQRFCWKCEHEFVPVGDCLEPSSTFSSPSLDLPTINLSKVYFNQAIMSDGTAVPLSVTDCNGDGKMDISVPWSETSAAQYATMLLSPTLCTDGAPARVKVDLVHFNNCTLQAKDDSGTVVDTAVADPTSGVQTLELTSASGIHRIEIIGSEICILKICWECGRETEVLQWSRF